MGADGDGPERLPKLNFRKENETSTEIGLADVKEKIAEVDERIERGEEPVITPQGRRIARGVPDADQRQSPETFLEDIRRLRSGMRLDGLD